MPEGEDRAPSQDDSGRAPPPETRGPDQQETIDETVAFRPNDGNVDRTDGVELPPPPKRLGRYEVRGTLGRGAFGTVFQGYDPELNREVAIKVPNRELLSAPGAVDAYLAEAKTLASLDHPGIVPVYDFGRTDDGSCYIVSKFIEGRSLGRLMAELRDSPRRFPVMASALAAVAEALHYAHKRGLVHCDIKPANLLITADDRPVVVDFGLALREQEQRGESGKIVGTPAYMAPEQVRGERHRLDGRTDIWALGVILYEILADRQPFAGETSAELFDAILHQDPKPPRLIDETVPFQLEWIALHCLAKSAAERYATAADLAVGLRSRTGLAKRVIIPANQVADLRRFVAANETRKYTPARWDWDAALVLKAVGALAVGLMFALSAFFARWVWGPNEPLRRRPPHAGIAGRPPRDVGKRPGAQLTQPPIVAKSPSDVGKPLPVVDRVPAHVDKAAPMLLLAPWGGWNVRIPRLALSVSDPSALPLNRDDHIEIEARLSGRAYVYVLRIGPDGQTGPVYPWRSGHWDKPEHERLISQFRLPVEVDAGRLVKEGPGMETLVLLAREEPLPAAVKLGPLLADFPRQVQQNPQSLVWFDEGSPSVDPEHAPKFFDPGKQNDPVLMTQKLLQQRLKPHFSMIRAVSFAKESSP